MSKFAGFTPQQQLVLLKRMGYSGSGQQDEMDNFLASSPKAAATLGRYAQMAQHRLKKPKVKMATGGYVEAQADLDKAQQDLADAQKAAASNPDSSSKAEDLSDAQNVYAGENTAFNTTAVPSSGEAVAQAVHNPNTLITPANVTQVATNSGQEIDKETGQAGAVDTVDPSTVSNTQTANAADAHDAATVNPTTISDDVKDELDNLEAQTAQPSSKATVQGQLESLMADFEGGATPPWASGAMRKAMSVMQQRGMGASSMAGSAVVQAAMESATAIASQDAQINAQFEQQNLSNRQQTAIYKTQQQIAAMTSDQAAENAAEQFNAASENQVKQFFAELQTTVSRFNAEQVNATLRFNAGETNTAKQFNASLKAQRDQFNATNDLVIAQANAKWRQDLATTDAEFANTANMENARQANGMTTRALDQIWQRERDLMNFAFASSESLEERNLKLLLANKQISAEADAQKDSALGYLAGRLLFG